jgi:hypothetical protein
MKYLKHTCVFIIITLTLSCSNNSEPTSPDSRQITLAKSDSVVVNLRYNQNAVINKKFGIKFIGVTADSRCPKNVNCVWAGDGETKITLIKDGVSENYSLHTTLEPKKINFSGYKILLKKLNPYPESVGEIKQEEYSVELEILYMDANEENSIKLIDEKDSLIKHDILTVNNVFCDKDTITLNITYSGGCKKHGINLYAYKTIEKSNPAKITVLLSHDNNDDSCEALITRKIKFNLKQLKEYLKENYDIQDKVVLRLFDPTGNPLYSSDVIYHF